MEEIEEELNNLKQIGFGLNSKQVNEYFKNDDIQSNQIVNYSN